MGQNVNIAVVMTHAKIKDTVFEICKIKSVTISVFAGRIANTEVDPVSHMKRSLEIINSKPLAQLLWVTP